MDKQQIIEQIKWMIADGNSDHEIEALLVGEGLARAEAKRTLAIIKHELFPDEYPEFIEPDKRRNYWWPVLLTLAAIFTLGILYYHHQHELNTAEREITPADMILLMKAGPGVYTTELNKINSGWVFDQDKDRWENKKRKTALAIRMEQLLYMCPVLHDHSFQDYLESHDFRDIIYGKPGSKIYQNNEFMFTIQTNGAYTMISLANR
ncbi:hypothetical protein ACQ86K_32295 [Mucilaginibacter sp. P19]|uniref:Uncharacterized protein n=1 Tax=Mucilaginibacter gossypii TaxID=551996 RepID=A0A1G8HWK8_9SPHI|nr:hypothetical protein [Mucilaginibacter gossypii]SDI11115.1 hypothetical protein SAMN05192573_11653 [Mucilaginibacter gossypii]